MENRGILLTRASLLFLLLLTGCSSGPGSGSVDAIIASPAGQQRIQQFQQRWDSANSKRLDLYGKILDQYGQPVAGAKVKGGVLLAVDVEHTKGEDHLTETDVQGQFSFTGLHGLELGIVPEKSGYFYDLTLAASRPDNYYKSDPRLSSYE